MNLSSLVDPLGNNRSVVVVSLLLRRKDRGGSAASAFQLVQVGRLLSYFLLNMERSLLKTLENFSHWLWWWPLSSLSFSISTTSLTGSWLISYSSWYWRKFNPPSIRFVLISRFHLSPGGKQSNLSKRSGYIFRGFHRQRISTWSTFGSYFFRCCLCWL